MTNDTDGYNDPYKVNISLNDDQDNQRKEFFEKGHTALLADPYFLLLYVPDNGSKMQVIRPTSDPSHRKRIIKRINDAKHIPSFYYALSHLWGLTENNRYYWHEIGDYVDDENGQPMKPVSMRPEKRDTLLALLKDHPDSYWWIDVLCARSDTPLDIMGDIYSCCLECVAMIDGEPTLIPQLCTMMIDVQKDFPTYYGADSVQLFHCNRNEKRLSQVTQLLFTLMQSQWWKRVWTWQEMALPFGNVRLIPETSAHDARSSTISVDDLLDYFLAYFRLDPIVHALNSVNSESGVTNAMDLHGWLDEISHARRANTHRTGGKNAQEFCYLIASWGYSPRRCMNPVDYVYGVLGVFQFKIPRMTDPNAVWQRFLSEMDNYLEMAGMSNNTLYGRKICDRAYQIDLRKARNMADVYGDDFLESTLGG
ncbi:hypothetical protein K492DRAFT_180001 [Lichtheimia hyalospora FSU 10163]|nr:hypothetical protein K492DRAFT_180001 [Lichtheimia hyalospora FSU 10163]